MCVCVCVCVQFLAISLDAATISVEKRFWYDGRGCT